VSAAYETVLVGETKEDQFWSSSSEERSKSFWETWTTETRCDWWA